MAYKVTKKQIKEMSNVELILNFEQCITWYDYEMNNTTRGLTKTTAQSYTLLKEALLDALECDQTYNSDYKVIDRCAKKQGLWLILMVNLLEA